MVLPGRVCEGRESDGFCCRGGQPVTQQQAFVPSPSPAGVRGSGITVCTQVLTPQLEEKEVEGRQAVLPRGEGFTLLV